MVMAQGRYPASTVTPLGIDRVGKSLCEKRVMQNRFFPPSLLSPLQFFLSLFLDLNKKELSLPVSLEAREALDVWIIPL